MALIELAEIGKVYHTGEIDVHALKSVSFAIEKGEFIAVMGPSGSGKSTLLHILGFLDRPTSGIYRFDDKKMQIYSDDELAAVRNKKMGFVFQSFNLLSRTSVLDNVRLPLSYAGASEKIQVKKARTAIKSVGLEHRMEHTPAQLSGGEKQRVAIARALVNDPLVIFADEPTGNLDSKSGGQVMEVIERLHKKDGRTIVLITHETYTAEYAQRIIHLKDGELESDKRVSQRHHRDGHFKK